VASRAVNSLSQSAQAGREAAWRATGGGPVSGGPPSSVAQAGSSVHADTAPQWARRLRAEQTSRAHRHATEQAIKDGDKQAAAANPDLKEKEE
jgi:type IV secretion system protein TrbL